MFSGSSISPIARRTIITAFASLVLAHAGELHQAARVCDADRMRQLLSGRPSLNQPGENGMTPLHVAIDSRQRACVWLLLKTGADRKARDREGRTAFDAAAQIADPRSRFVMDYMLRDFEMAPESSGPMPWSLEYSVTRRQTEVKKMLVTHGADVNARTRDELQTPLHIAAAMGKMKAVEALVGTRRGSDDQRRPGADAARCCRTGQPDRCRCFPQARRGGRIIPAP